jgi:CRISPR/Cas system-associated exonuclease Cas4 (RecB family)
MDGQPTLVSHRFRLAGRPDYVTRGRRGLVPAEIKSRACGSRGPHPSERAQLLAYCLLVEEAFNASVHAGVLQYPRPQRDGAVRGPGAPRDHGAARGDGYRA